jgi:hypothetical protein
MNNYLASPDHQSTRAQERKTINDTGELSDRDLNEVSGGVVVTKRMDASSPGLWTDSVAGPLSTTK